VKVSLAELISGGVFDFETLEGLGELGFDGSLVLTLHLGANFGGREGVLDRSDVGFELLLGLVLGGEVLVGLRKRRSDNVSNGSRESEKIGKCKKLTCLNSSASLII
jgi:hypothetical protein